MDKYGITTDDIIYRCPRFTSTPKQKPRLEVLGIDTEADRDGNPFMVGISDGNYFDIRDWPNCMFGRKYCDKKYVAYNLSYDESALLKMLPKTTLTELWQTGKTEFNNFEYKCIPKKMLQIKMKHRRITIYDMLNFYGGSLNFNANKYLGKSKRDIDPKIFYPPVIRRYWDLIGKYCAYDALLVKQLADYLLDMFEQLGITPQKLFSVAYVSYQYFRTHCKYVTVRRYWDKYRDVLNYAMLSYNGGKFEVTQKCAKHLYEYDIISAYPYEIANLIDISFARVTHDKQYRKSAIYGFLKVHMKIPPELPSPIALRYGSVNVYPVGEIVKHITKSEYEYLTANGADVTIIDAYWLFSDQRFKPYRKQIDEIMKMKNDAKQTDDKLRYHTVKILMNSLYGKFVQLVQQGDKWKAGMNWNPIYGAVITANCRVKISELQLKYPDIVAVHTDSVISRSRLPFGTDGKLGDMIYETDGEGVILGSGIYQIGDKIRFRGFNVSKNYEKRPQAPQDIKTDHELVYTYDLFSLFQYNSESIKIFAERPLSWREVTFHGWDSQLINKFTDVSKNVNVRFDKKRIWLNDYRSFAEIPTRDVYSTPHIGLIVPGRSDIFNRFTLV